MTTTLSSLLAFAKLRQSKGGGGQRPEGDLHNPVNQELKRNPDCFVPRNDLRTVLFRLPSLRGTKQSLHLYPRYAFAKASAYALRGIMAQAFYFKFTLTVTKALSSLHVFAKLRQSKGVGGQMPEGDLLKY
ncbi:MAG: hypothetical protein ACI9Z3_000117 [Roseivirga sp.]